MLKTILLSIGLACGGLLNAQKGLKCEQEAAKIEDLKGNDLGNPVNTTNYTGGVKVSAENCAPRFYTVEELGKSKVVDDPVPVKNDFNSNFTFSLRKVQVNISNGDGAYTEYKSIQDFRSNRPKKTAMVSSSFGCNYASLGLYEHAQEFLTNFGFSVDDNAFFSSKSTQFSIEMEFNEYRGGMISKTNLRLHTYTGVIRVYDDYNNELGSYDFKVDGMSSSTSLFEYSYSFWRKQILLNDWTSGVTIALADFLHSDFLKEITSNWKSKLNAHNDYELLKITSSNKGRRSISESMECVITLESKDGHGSGCIVSDDGYVLTNYHVAFGSKDTLFAVLSTGEKFEVDIIREDPEADLALLKMKGDRVFKSLRVNENPNLKLGQPVAVIGTPANSALGQTVTKGIFSSERDAFGIKMYQTDAHVNPGNSGGALVDENGTLIGVVSSKAIGSVVEGVGFAISSEIIFSRLKLNY